MSPKLAVAALALAAIGCQLAKPPSAPVSTVAPVLKAVPVETPAPEPMTVALLEPYLVAVVTPSPGLVPQPSPLSGRIVAPEPIAPLAPAPPTQTVPITPGSPPQAAPKAAPTRPQTTMIPPAVVRLLEDERARSVDDARRRLSAATTRAGQAATEAKRQWGFVKDGFVAQKQAENADTTARDAVAEQAEAQKTLDEAQRRQGEAKRDLQRAYSAIALTPALEETALERPAPSYQPVPFTYRLSILGAKAPKFAVENGTLGHPLPSSSGEAGAWLVRCADPSRLLVRVGADEAAIVRRSLPALGKAPPKA